MYIKLIVKYYILFITISETLILDIGTIQEISHDSPILIFNN